MSGLDLIRSAISNTFRFTPDKIWFGQTLRRYSAVDATVVSKKSMRVFIMGRWGPVTAERRPLPWRLRPAPRDEAGAMRRERAMARVYSLRRDEADRVRGAPRDTRWILTAERTTRAYGEG